MTTFLALSACSAPDPGVYPYGGTNTKSPTSNTPPQGAVSADSGSSSVVPPSTFDAGVDSGIGAGTTDPSDSGAGGEASGAAAFLGETTPYASQPIAVTALQHHQSAGQPAQTPTLNCLGCHGPGGVGVQFLAAGFLATQANGTNGAADVEVRIWSTATSAGASNHSDSDGYYWIKPGAGAVTAPFQAGIRDATHQVLMPTDASGGGCNGSSCHGGGQGAVHI